MTKLNVLSHGCQFILAWPVLKAGNLERVSITTCSLLFYPQKLAWNYPGILTNVSSIYSNLARI